MDVGSGVNALIDATKGWIKQPFTSQGDLLHWFLIVGAVLVFSLIWARILSNFKE